MTSSENPETKKEIDKLKKEISKLQRSYDSLSLQYSNQNKMLRILAQDVSALRRAGLTLENLKAQVKHDEV